MPNTETKIKLERGTVRTLWREMNDAGEPVPYMTLYNRIHCLSHVETIRRATEVSGRIAAKKQRRQAEIKRIIENSKQEEAA